MSERTERFEFASKTRDFPDNWSEHGLSQNDRSLLNPDPSSKPMMDVGLPVVSFVKEHPIASSALIVGAALVGHRLLSRSVDKAIASIGETAVINGEFRSGQGLLRDFTGSAIPDIERPFLKELVDGAAISSRAREGYASDLMRAACLPKSAVGLADETIDKFAERMLTNRTAITGERLSADSIAKEAERIATLNAGVFSEAQVAAELKLGGKTLTTMNKEHFAKLAEEMQFKHVPQLGQLMKSTGRISEEQIAEAVRIQQGFAKGTAPKLGEILVDRGLASKGDVDLAFASQNELKSVLKTLREKFLSIEQSHAARMR